MERLIEGAMPASHQGVIHRVIERQAAEHGDTIAWIDPGRVLSYRELNTRANAVARHLMAHGVRKGSVVRVACEPRADLVVTLLGVLKAGGCYVCVSRDDMPPDATIVVSANRDACGEPITLGTLLDESPPWSSNLPVLLRPSDPAWLLGAGHELVVSHGTVTALMATRPPGRGPREVIWRQGSFELWLGLMSGATVATHERVNRAA